MLKRVKNIIIVIIIILLFHTNVNAHSKNITGWQSKDTTEIIKYNGIFYGYHSENGIKHYHQVEWDEEKQKWVIINAAVYYDENFNIINNYENIETEKIEVMYYTSVDGDTAKFKLNNEIITVRFLGIDTPETVHTQKEEQPYGKEASYYTKEKLENAKKIKIEYDDKASKTDQYDRILAWIWVDDSLLQEELVSNGLARTYMLQNNYKYAGQLQLAESDAKSKGLCIWNSETEDDNTTENNVDNNQINGGTIGIMLILIFGLVMVVFEKIKNRKKDSNNGSKN